MTRMTNQKTPIITATLLINLGTPDNCDTRSIQRYLKDFLSDPRVIELPTFLWQLILRFFILPFRSPKTARSYQKIWRNNPSQSPLLFHTIQQTQKLDALMPNNHRVDFAMRYGKPSIEEKILHLFNQGQGATLLNILPLYPQYSATTTASVYDEVYRILKKMRWQPSIVSIPPYFNNLQYIQLLKNSIQEHLAQINFVPDAILCSFHGIPISYVAKGDPYEAQCQETFHLLKQILTPLYPTTPVRLCFQSRFGPKKWLSPYTRDLLTECIQQKACKVVIITPGFPSDCLETLEELQITERKIFLEKGGTHYSLIPCLNAQTDHIHFLRSLICPPI